MKAREVLLKNVQYIKKKNKTVRKITSDTNFP